MTEQGTLPKGTEKPTEEPAAGEAVVWAQKPGNTASVPLVQAITQHQPDRKVRAPRKAASTAAAAAAPAATAMVTRDKSDIDRLAEKQLQIEAMTGVPRQLLLTFNQGGKPTIYITAQGLLVRAKQEGLKSIITTLPHRATKEEPWFEAETTVEMKDGRRANAFASASADNVKLAEVKQRLMEMAETRSVRRALSKLLAGGFPTLDGTAREDPYREPSATDVMATAEQLDEIRKAVGTNIRRVEIVREFLNSNGFGELEDLTADAAEAVLGMLEPRVYVG